MSEHSGQFEEFEPGVPRGRQRASVGLAAYVLPFLSSAAMVLWLTRPEAPQESPRLRVEVLPESVESARVFLGVRDDWRGGTLLARLSPAQPEASRREFDNQALGERLDAGAGQAWHLELMWKPVGESTERAPLESVSVSDAYGEALAPLEARAGQPLRALFAAPEALPGNEAVHLLLWGRAPAGGVRLQWATDAGDHELALDATREDTQGLPESLVGWAPKPAERR
ncbi:MAG: hypothetical protein ACYS26_13175 [Planctomycetota bacterium]